MKTWTRIQTIRQEKKQTYTVNILLRNVLKTQL
jgi:hypothetical protein